MATKKAATPNDEKLDRQDFELFPALAQIDAKNHLYYSTLSEEQQRKFVPYMMTHWTSSIKAGGQLGAYYVMSTDFNANTYLFNEYIQRHPELQWMMLCAASPGIGKQLHTWLPHMKEKVAQLKEPANKKDVKEYFTKVYKASADVLEEVAETYTAVQRHQYKLAEMYPEMKIEDIKLLGELVSEQDIKEYEHARGD